MRKGWHKHWIDRCYINSEMSTCASGRKVGAVIVTKDNRSLSDGFNGVPSGYPHPSLCARIEAKVKSGESLDMCPCAHAESNAIDNAARHGIAIKDSFIYCTTKPCSFCMARIANAGICKVFYVEEYSHNLTDQIAQNANIELNCLKDFV